LLPGSRRVDIQLGDRVIVVGATEKLASTPFNLRALGASEVIGIARNQEKLQNNLTMELLTHQYSEKVLEGSRQ
jgi:short-subunit dehydrogenase